MKDVFRTWSDDPRFPHYPGLKAALARLNRAAPIEAGTAETGTGSVRSTKAGKAARKAPA